LSQIKARQFCTANIIHLSKNSTSFRLLGGAAQQFLFTNITK